MLTLHITRDMFTDPCWEPNDTSTYQGIDGRVQMKCEFSGRNIGQADTFDEAEEFIWLSRAAVRNRLTVDERTKIECYPFADDDKSRQILLVEQAH